MRTQPILSMAALVTAVLIGSLVPAAAAVTPTDVPEPMSIGLFAAGAAGLYVLRKLRDR